MLHRSHGDTTGYCVIEDVWRSVIAGFTMDGGQLNEIRLYPLSLGMGQPWARRGWPHLSGDEKTLQHLAALSEPFGTELVIRDGVGIIRP